MNPEQKNDDLSNREKINILMKEYDTLRAEIINRCNTRFAFVGLFGALGTYAFVNTCALTLPTLSFFLFAALLLLFLWLYIGHLIIRCSRRIAEIENQANALAGKQLLVWENRQKINIFHKLDEKVWAPKEDRANQSIDRDP